MKSKHFLLQRRDVKHNTKADLTFSRPRLIVYGVVEQRGKEGGVPSPLNGWQVYSSARSAEANIFCCKVQYKKTQIRMQHSLSPGIVTSLNKSSNGGRKREVYRHPEEGDKYTIIHLPLKSKHFLLQDTMQNSQNECRSYLLSTATHRSWCRWAAEWSGRFAVTLKRVASTLFCLLGGGSELSSEENLCQNKGGGDAMAPRRRCGVRVRL